VFHLWVDRLRAHGPGTKPSANTVTNVAGAIVDRGKGCNGKTNDSGGQDNPVNRDGAVFTARKISNLLKHVTSFLV